MTGRTRRIALGVLMLAVLTAYVLSALTYGRTLRSTSTPVGFHAVTADALLHGHVAIESAPLGLTQLTDPQDPVANAEYRNAGLHDYAYFDGKIYSAMGPTPAVLLHVPYRLLGLGNLNPNLATLFAIGCGFLASVAAFGELRRRFFVSIPLGLECTAVVGLGLGTPLPWLVSIGRAYESAIACGFMLMAIGIWALLRALRPDRFAPHRGLLGLAAVSFALAVGARPHLAAAVIFVGLAIVAIVRSETLTGAVKRSAVLAITVPYVFVGCLLGLYNYVRFKSFTDFGTHHQMAGVDMSTYPMFSIRSLPPNVFDYLLLPPRVESKWPFIHLSTLTNISDVSRHSHEPVAGALWLFPFTVLGLVVAVVVIRRMFQAERALAWMNVAAVAVLICIVTAVGVSFNASTMRYTVDFVPLMALISATAIAWCCVHVGGWQHRMLAGSFVVATTVSVLLGVALVLTDCPGTGSC